MATKDHPLPVPGNEAQNLPALPDLATLKEVIETNLEGIQPSFETIKVPTGGSLAWTIPGEEEPEVVKELVGVILDHYPTRAYWADEYTGGNAPPVCSSLDARKGSLPRVEVNGESAYGECVSCQFRQWGTGKDGRGQACKFKHRVFILLRESMSIFPYLLSLPATSAPEKGGYEGSFPTYVTKQSGKLRKYHHIVTKVKLISDNAKTYTIRKDGKEVTIGGEKFAKAVFFYVDTLNENDRKAVDFLRGQLSAVMRSKPFETEELGDAKEEDGNKDPWDK